MVCRSVHLVVDSGAFIRNFPVQDHAENAYSVAGAIGEIKDKATRQRLQVLPYELKVKEPEPENLKYVTEFAKKTGDYASLSAIDLKVIALTYQLEKEFVGTDHLNTEPKCQVTGRSPVDTKPLEGFYNPKTNKKESLSEKPLENQSDAETVPHKIQVDANSLCDTDKLNGTGADSTNEEVHDAASDDEDDEDSWITPENLSEVQQKMGSLMLDSNTNLVVACVTTDFAVQNVLLQMGLQVISVDGMLIKQARVFILRCFACYKTTNDTTKKFCPNCGNSTLKRVSVTVNDDGTKNIHINFRRPLNIRGKKYSLPMPKGGKHSNDPILFEDQPVPHNRPPKSSLCKIDVFSPDYLVSTSPFAVHDVHSRAANLGIRKNCSQEHFRRKNPNEWSKRTGNRK